MVVEVGQSLVKLGGESVLEAVKILPGVEGGLRRRAGNYGGDPVEDQVLAEAGPSDSYR